MAAHGSGEASTAGQPDTEPEEPKPDTECENGLRPSSAHGPQPAGRAGAAPWANPAHHADASAPGEMPPRDQPETRATSKTRETTPDTPQRAAGRKTSPSRHNRDDDSFMESCMGDPHTVSTPAGPRVRPEQQRDHAEDTPLTIPRQAHLQRNYTALGHTGHATASGDGHAAASGAADQTTDERGVPESGARVEAGTNTASKPTGPPPGTAPPWGRGHLDYARLEGDASRSSDQAEKGGGPRPWPIGPQAYRRGAARPGSPRPIAAHFAVPPPHGGHPRHGRHHLWPSNGAHAPRHHEPPRPMALCGHPAHGAHGGPTARMK